MGIPGVRDGGEGATRNVHQAGLRDKMEVKVAKSGLFVQRLRSQQKMGPPAGDREVNLDISHEVQRTRQTSYKGMVSIWCGRKGPSGIMPRPVWRN